MAVKKSVKKKPKNLLIGFIGQGFVGGAYADDFENRGYSVVRYSLEPKYIHNKGQIASCDIVFICVPTPTTAKGFDISIIEAGLMLVGTRKTAVIKSTLTPGSTRALQRRFPELFVMHSPEFLVQKTAAQDAAEPKRSIVGIPSDSRAYRLRAREVLDILPSASYERIVSAEDAELIKYGGNFFLYLKVVFANILYEAAESVDADYEAVREALSMDPRIGPSHLEIMHASGHRGAKSGRGAGGACFIKDVEAFRRFYLQQVDDRLGAEFLDAAIEKNIALLKESKKDAELLASTYPDVHTATTGKKKRTRDTMKI
jgi:UDPglucose 6-dehydrogenase